MSELEAIEFTAMIISLIAIINIPYIIKRRKEFIKYLPGFVSLMIYFTADTLDDLFPGIFFVLIEIIAYFFGAILLLIAALIDLKKTFPKRKESTAKNAFKKKKLIGD